MKLDFSNRTVVVTGGARGIGAGICEAFARAGANVVVDYIPIDQDVAGLRQLEGRLQELGASYATYAADVTSPQEMAALCDAAVQDFGGLDVVVNSAGFTQPVGMAEISQELWQRGLDVNLSGAFYLSQAAAEHMTRGGRGRIIYIGSAGSITGGGGAAFYSAAKAGINGLVRVLSKELAPRGITVNAVLPALIDTDLLRERQPDPIKRQEYVSRIPVGRLGRPEDVAAMVLFLASEHAGFVTGQNIIVDGGATYK